MERGGFKVEARWREADLRWRQVDLRWRERKRRLKTDFEGGAGRWNNLD